MSMSKPYTGGCACGAIRYEISCEPLVMTDCQCRDCQRESGTGHGSLPDLPALRCDGHGRGDPLGHGGRQRQGEDAGLLPDLRLSGLHDGRALPRMSSSCARRALTIPAGTSRRWCSIPRAVRPGIASIRTCRHSSACRRCDAGGEDGLEGKELGDSLAVYLSPAGRGRAQRGLRGYRFNRRGRNPSPAPPARPLPQGEVNPSLVLRSDVTPLPALISRRDPKASQRQLTSQTLKTRTGRGSCRWTCSWEC